MPMTKTSSLVAVVVASLAVQGAAAAPKKTPDQQLVAGLKTARAASRTALESISPASATGARQAETALSRAIKGIGTANNVAASAVGALETPSVRTALRQGTALARQARTDVVRGRYAAARVKLRRADALTSAALSDFGVPLERDFPAVVTVRQDVDYTGYKSPWKPYPPKPGDPIPPDPPPDPPSPGVLGRGGYTGVSALVGREIVEVVIGPADRRTANAGERGAASSTSRGLPIKYMGPAFLVEASGRYTTNWCTLKSGLITCRLYSPMPADKVFMLGFGPMLPKGTKLLVKFRSSRGERSFAVGRTP